MIETLCYGQELLRYLVRGSMFCSSIMIAEETQKARTCSRDAPLPVRRSRARDAISRDSEAVQPLELLTAWERIMRRPNSLRSRALEGGNERVSSRPLVRCLMASTYAGRPNDRSPARRQYSIARSVRPASVK